MAVVAAIGTARMPDGTVLRTLHWEPPGDPWAVATIVHGLGEHAGRYQSVADALTGDEIDTWAHDHRGNGRSGGRRAWVDRWSRLHDDLEARVTELRDLAAGRPLVLYGHSLGGLVACGYVLSPQPRPLPDLLVLSAPSLADSLPGWQRPAARVLNGLVPRLRLPNGLPAGALSRDPEVEVRAAADPLCSTRSTVRWGNEAFREQDRIRDLLQDLPAMPMPTYVLHGSADRLVPLEASAVFEGMGNVTRRVHEGLRHETHHEPEREAVLGEVVAWIRANAPAARAA